MPLVISVLPRDWVSTRAQFTIQFEMNHVFETAGVRMRNKNSDDPEEVASLSEPDADDLKGKDVSKSANEREARQPVSLDEFLTAGNDETSFAGLYELSQSPIDKLYENRFNTSIAKLYGGLDATTARERAVAAAVAFS